MDRFRLLAAALVAIVCIALLALAPTASAAQTLPLGGPAAGAGISEPEEEDEGEEEGDDGEEEADECESDDEALEEACEEAAEEREAEEAEAEECRLETAEATVAAVPGRNQLRLTVRYKTFQPSAVAIALVSRGDKGALDLGTETAHFGRAGAFHSTETLTDSQMARAMAAREFTVGLHAVNTPGYCGERLQRHLSSRHGTGGAPQWSDPSSSRRAKASRR